MQTTINSPYPTYPLAISVRAFLDKLYLNSSIGGRNHNITEFKSYGLFLRDVILNIHSSVDFVILVNGITIEIKYFCFLLLKTFSDS